MTRKYVLAINPGSTSTKLSIFEEEIEIKSNKVEHDRIELEVFSHVIDQYQYRLELILKWLMDEGINLNELIAVVGRGGLLRSIPGGTYTVTDFMIEDLTNCINGEHASNLGGLLARGIADMVQIPSYIVDPVSVDEFKDVSRISGLKEISRISLVHTLNIKAVINRRAKEINKNVEDLNFIVAHLGGGISISPIEKGKIIDVNNANHGGPFSPERAGTLPCGDLVKLCYSGKYTYQEMKSMIQHKGGLYSYLGTSDAREVYNRILQGDKYAELIYDAMAYQIGKEIACSAPPLKGKVDNIIITGGLAYAAYLLGKIEEMVKFIAPIIIYPGENEMEALNLGVLRVIHNKEKHKIYDEEVGTWQKILVNC